MGINFVDNCLIVGHYSCPVRSLFGQIRPGPVKDRHKIVTNQVYPRFAQILQGCTIIVDVMVPFRRAYLDGIMYINAFNSRDNKPAILHGFFKITDFFLFPDFARVFPVQGSYNPANTGNLPDIL